MATNFPTSLDTFPSAATLATHTLGTDPHSTLHGNLGDSLAALEAKVGVDGSAVTTSLDYQAKRPNAPDGRLTLTTAVPVTTSDVTAAGTIYFTPYNGNSISLYDTTATKWFRYTFAEVSASLSGLTSLLPADVFAYLSSGTLTLDVVNWTNGTTRATALVLQDGTYVKSGATNRLYLGTVCGSGSGTCEDSLALRFVWNQYNRVTRSMVVNEATASWTYNLAAYRSINASTANRLQVVSGLGTSLLQVVVTSWSTASDTNHGRYNAIGVDSVSVASADHIIAAGDTAARTTSASLASYPSIGYHYYQGLESCDTTVATFYGGNTAANRTTNIVGLWEA